MELPFERQAMRGEPLPEDLMGADVWMYIALRNLYSAYRREEIDQKTAKREKIALIKSWSASKRRDELDKKADARWIATTMPATKYIENPCQETADAFFAAVYGLPKDWRSKKIETILSKTETDE